MQPSKKIEEWRPVPEWEGLYEVSSLGRVRSLDRVVETSTGPRKYRGGQRSLVPDREGYLMVILSYKGEQNIRKVHALVLDAFVGPRPEGLQVCHNDGDPTNNRVDNLRYGTGSENSEDMLVHGTRRVGEKHHNCRLTEDDVREIRRSRGKVTQRELAKMFGVSQPHIGAIQRGRFWGRINDAEVS